MTMVALKNAKRLVYASEASMHAHTYITQEKKRRSVSCPLKKVFFFLILRCHENEKPGEGSDMSNVEGGGGREEHTAIKTKKRGKKKREPTNADSKHVLKRPTSRAHMFIWLASDKARVPSFQSLQARLQASDVYMCIVRSTTKKTRIRIHMRRQNRVRRNLTCCS